VITSLEIGSFPSANPIAPRDSVPCRTNGSAMRDAPRQVVNPTGLTIRYVAVSALSSRYVAAPALQEAATQA